MNASLVRWLRVCTVFYCFLLNGGVLVIIYGPNRYVTGDNTCKYVTALFKIKRLENNN